MVPNLSAEQAGSLLLRARGAPLHFHGDSVELDSLHRVSMETVEDP